MNGKYEEQEPMDPVVDERLQDIETERDFAVSDKIAEYNDMMARSERDKEQALAGLDASKKEQEQILNDSYELTKSELEDSKEQARDSYKNEQSAAYVDYKKASDPYGANAEQMAAAGMSRTGYSESSRVRMYNQYQARVAVARDTFKRAEVEYGKAMAEAKLKNSSALAEIAARTYEKQIEISMSYLAEYYALLEQRDAAIGKINDEYSERWLDMLKVIEAEKAAEEEAKKAEAEKAAASAAGTSKEDSEGGTDTLTDEEIELLWEMYPEDGPNHKEGGTYYDDYSGILPSVKTGSETLIPSVDQAAKNSMTRPTLGGTKEGASGALRIDRNSLIELGFGNKSNAEINQLVKAGIIVPVRVGNKLIFKDGYYWD